MGRGSPERHKSQRASWLRAAVLGADDGLVSTASLMLGVAAATNTRAAVLTAGLAGLASGASSMAAGEYVSVSSQRDTELADLETERRELAEVPDAELDELAEIYRRRGLNPTLARQVAVELSAHDTLAAHARDELGLDPKALANPRQASMVSAISFGAGAVIPVFVGGLVGGTGRFVVLVAVTLVALGLLGALGARAGGAPVRRAAFRVLVGGSAALAITAVVGWFAGGVA